MNIEEQPPIFLSTIEMELRDTGPGGWVWSIDNTSLFPDVTDPLSFDQARAALIEEMGRLQEPKAGAP